jgi:hypothetical protein
MEYLSVSLSCSETKDLVKWLHEISFTRHIFIGINNQQCYLFALDYYEQFILARSLLPAPIVQHAAFAGLTVGIEKDVLSSYLRSVLTHTPGQPSLLRVGLAANTIPREIWGGDTMFVIHHTRNIQYAMQFTHNLSCPKEFCKHVINFCLLGSPCKVAIVQRNQQDYLSLHAKNALCDFKNLFVLHSLREKHGAPQDEESHPENEEQPANEDKVLSISMRNTRTVHQRIMRQPSVSIAMTGDILAFVIDLYTVAIMADDRTHGLCTEVKQ